jgi:4-cresol dehydrogenase (hydroxylating)
MGNAKLTEELECAWPAKFGSWASRVDASPTLCRSEREVPWRVRPPSVEDVREVVREAGRNRTPLWPVSTGRNWGYGSHLPARDGSVVVDLSALDSIGDMDRPSLSVRIGPGATQAALHTFLLKNAPDLAFNVTGSGGTTSVLGNALERGIGYAGEKDTEVYALEVVLADGSLVGPSAKRNHKSRTHPAGLSQDGLFFQSSLGIVVGARIRLRIRQEAEEAVVLQGTLEGVIGTLKAGYDRRLLSGPTHVSEPGRTQRLGFGMLRNLWQREPTPAEVDACFPEHSTYNGLFPMSGQRRVVDATWKELKGSALPGVRFRRADSAKIASAAKWLRLVGARNPSTRLLAIRPLLALTWGEPSEVGLASLDGYRGGDPDRATRGAIYGNAVSSVSSDEAKRASGIVRRHWKDSAFTWILLDSRCMITVYTLHFDDARAKDVHAASTAIVDDLVSSGLPLYRGGINVRVPGGPDPVARRIKEAFDPLGIISPGRYET